MNGYDQWKTASPYDDEPDVVDECERTAARIKVAFEHFDRQTIYSIQCLLNDARYTLEEAAEFIKDNV